MGSGGATTTTTTGSGGVGGVGTCTLGDIGACGGGQKCTVVEIASGKIGCGTAGPKMIWQKCTSDGDCADGLWCDQLLQTCKPFCTSAGQCMFDVQGECVAALKPDKQAIPGNVRHCISNCHPMNGLPCDVNGNVTCVYIGSDGFDCARSEGKLAGSACTGSMNCAPGLVCAGTGNDKKCRKWCTPPTVLNFDCIPNECLPLNPKIVYQTYDMGACF